MSEKSFRQIEDIQAQLQKALAECARLTEENARLKMLLNLQGEKAKHSSLADTLEPVLQVSTVTGTISNNSSADSKIDLFRSFFRGREDVYPVRWEGKYGKSGYSPACANEWKK